MEEIEQKNLETSYPITLYGPGRFKRTIEAVRDAGKDLAKRAEPLYQGVLRRAREYRERN